MKTAQSASVCPEGTPASSVVQVLPSASLFPLMDSEQTLHGSEVHADMSIKYFSVILYTSASRRFGSRCCVVLLLHCVWQLCRDKFWYLITHETIRQHIQSMKWAARSPAAALTWWTLNASLLLLCLMTSVLIIGTVRSLNEKVEEVHFWLWLCLL